MAFRVGDKYRLSELSMRGGGYVVVVEYANGAVYEYDKIKRPHSYIKVVAQKENVVNAWVKKPGEKDTPSGNVIATF